ncbi:two-component system response regulator DcuR [Pectobacterium sp. B2J-2]|uniref:two-component system response regulator DcuR n=1 Tax=Pectobacterium sp. B2J-2 TaxID=3385372 RepID=UPI0038FCA58B
MMNVLIVDDDAMVAELNRIYVGKISGFYCCGIASTLQQARDMLSNNLFSIDLVLLDIYMQKENGLELLPDIRRTKQSIDVIVITSATDAITVKQSLHYGVVDYLIKPFQFPRFEEALITWREKRKFMNTQSSYEQSDVDRLLHGNPIRITSFNKLPKGLTSQTLQTICKWINEHKDTEFSTSDLAKEINLSRVSCRKYIMWLEQNNTLHTTIHYGTSGRPMYLYRLAEGQYGLNEFFQDDYYG